MRAVSLAGVKGKGKGGGSGAGLNPVGPDGQRMKCHECQSDRHLIAKCPNKRRAYVTAPDIIGDHTAVSADVLRTPEFLLTTPDSPKLHLTTFHSYAPSTAHLYSYAPSTAHPVIPEPFLEEVEESDEETATTGEQKGKSENQ